MYMWVFLFFFKCLSQTVCSFAWQFFWLDSSFIIEARKWSLFVAGSGNCTHSNSVIWDKQTNLSMPKQRTLPASLFFLVTVFFKMTFLLILELETLVIIYLILDFCNHFKKTREFCKAMHNSLKVFVLVFGFGFGYKFLIEPKCLIEFYKIVLTIKTDQLSRYLIGTTAKKTLSRSFFPHYFWKPMKN